MEKPIQIIDDDRKINSIFTLLHKTNAVFILRNSLAEYRGKISEIQFDQFSFISDVKISDIKQDISISFFYLNKYHYFDTVILHSDEKELILKIPEQIYIHIKRQYKRYDIEDESLTCNLKVINYNSDIQSDLEMKKATGTLREIYTELNSDKPDFSKIVKLIYEDNKNICDDFRIFTSLEKFPDKNVASFLSSYKKPLLLNNLLEIKYDPYQSTNRENSNFYVLKDYIDFLSSNTDAANAKTIIMNLAQYYKKDSIYSLLYVPVIVLQKVIGVIRIFNTLSSRRLFNNNDVEYFIFIAKIINESIIKNKLNSIDDYSMNIRIRDMSLSGIGIEIMDPIFSTFLKRNTSLKVVINQNEKPWISYIGFIKRIVQKKEVINLGIEINEILPANLTKLVNYVNKVLEKKA